MTSRRLAPRAVALAAIVSLACACGGATKTASSHSPLPGAGRPTIVIGDTGSAEQLVLGELYAQAFRAQGYVVVLEPNLADSQLTSSALQSGRIDAYPQDLGEIVATDGGGTPPIASESEVEQVAQQYEQFHGATAMMPVTPFADTGAAVTLASFAKERNLTTLEQLKALPFRLKFGDYAVAQSQYGGYAGLQEAYGLTNVEFVPLAAGSSVYAALDTHQVQVADGSWTDPQMLAGTYAVLSDPKSIFGFHHFALIIRTSLLNRLGPQFQQIYSSVTSLLTLSVMQSLNRAVEVDGQLPASVAHAFLVANGLTAS